MTSVTTWDPQVDRTFALIEQLSEPLDEALCSQAVEAAVRTQKTQLASRFMDTWPGRWTVDETLQKGDPGCTLWLCQNSYWKWPFIVSFPIKNGDFP